MSALLQHVASVNGVPLHAPDEALDDEALRQRACTELLRQAAIDAGLLAADDPAPQRGATSEPASDAIEALLARALHLPEPDEAACLRHVLFAVTPGVDVRRLRERAESLLLQVRCRRDGMADPFPAAAAEWSNCPSGAEGGHLGWLRPEDVAPEFARELFAGTEIGVLPRLVHSRFGLHVVEVLQRETGAAPDFEAVRGAVALSLMQQTFVGALRQYLQLLAGAARVEGVVLDSADTPLVQ